MFIAYIVVMVSRMHTYLQTRQVVDIKYIQLLMLIIPQ